MKKILFILTVLLILVTSSVKSQEEGSDFPGAGGQDNCPGGSCSFTNTDLMVLLILLVQLVHKKINHLGVIKMVATPGKFNYYICVYFEYLIKYTQHI